MARAFARAPLRTLRHYAAMTGILVPAATAAKRLGVSSQTVRTWIDSDVIPGRRMGRNYYVFRNALDALKQANERAADVDLDALAQRVADAARS